jgi:uncharacterized protein YwqG
MKKKKVNLLKLIFNTLLLIFTVIYFSELTGYYEYHNYEKASLTKEQILEFENDIKNGKQIDVNEYLKANTKKFDNKLTKIASNLSEGISSVVEKGVNYTFKTLAKLIDE